MKLAILLLASIAAFGEPFLVYPVGSYEDVPFADQDLLNVALEFPSEPGAYFGNEQQTVICIPSLLNPSIGWCAPKAEANPFVGGFVGGKSVYPTPDPKPVPQVVATPEPDALAIVLFVLLFLVLVILKRRPKCSERL